MSQITIYNYQGFEIPFERKGDLILVNATKMAANYPDHKTPSHFLRNGKTKDFISALSRCANLHSEKIVVRVNGGVHFGTWMHRQLALKFAAWLDPDFEVWVYEMIEKLLTDGFVSLIKAERNRKIPNWEESRDFTKSATNAVNQSLYEFARNNPALSEQKRKWLYKNECDRMNKIVFGMIARVWRKNNPTLAKGNKNMRDYAERWQLATILKLYHLDEWLIREGMADIDRQPLLIAEFDRVAPLYQAEQRKIEAKMNQLQIG